jgi:hypothetical protein
MTDDLLIVHDSADELETTAVAVRGNGATANGEVSIGALMHMAIDRGLPAAELKELFALHERMTDREAANEFNRAFILTHVNGHSRRTHFTVPTENKSGMSPQQKIGAADSFAKRKSMCNGLGIVTTDNEVDPQAEAEENSPPITSQQAIELTHLIRESKTNLDRLLRYLEIQKIEQLPATKFEALKRQLLERKAERETGK